MIQSITKPQIAAYRKDWPKDRMIVRQVNGDQGQHWAVCDEKTWSIVALSYTETEAAHICALFNKKGTKP